MGLAPQLFVTILITSISPYSESLLEESKVDIEVNEIEQHHTMVAPDIDVPKHEHATAVE